MDLGLQGARVAVTGGSRGIGRQVVSTLLAEGARVATCGRDAEALDSAVAELAKLGEVWGAPADVTVPEQLTGWLDAATEHLGGLDVLVCNASVQPAGEDDSTWETAFQGDLMQAVRAVRHVGPLLGESDRGAVVLVSSVTALSAATGPGQLAYGTVKSALLTLNAKLSRQLGRQGVRVNAVVPGVVTFPGGVWDRLAGAAPEMVAGVAAGTSLGRLGTPADVADVVAFLASPRAAYITGAAVRVDGGLTDAVDT
ncbi:MAG: SDR family NAD(P)-dependent oxidoreductase [Actinomycetes bacterium]